jgi:peptidoglycan/LPS O-acetylase OafA/YrhL
MDRKFVVTGLGFGILGLLLGIYMAASHNHGQLVTHAHIMLVGFVVSFVYGVCHKLWLGNNESGLARIQFYLHVVGAIGLTIGLFLLYGGIVAPENIEPVLSISSIAVLIGMILMKVLFVRSKN